MLGAFGKGFIIGIGIAVPIGPLGIILIRRTLTVGRLVGLATGFGIALADLIYASIAAFGVSFLMDFLVDQQVAIRLLGAAFLTYLAIKIFLKPAPVVNNTEDNSAKAVLASFFSSFFLAMADPMTIVFFAAIFSSFCLEQQGFGAAIQLVLGVPLGALTWFSCLSEVVYYFKEKFTTRLLKITNIFSGIILLGFATIAAGTAIYKICIIL